MDTPVRRSLSFDVLWLLFWAVLSSLWCVTAADRLSATYDEPAYVELGLARWRTGSTGALLKLGTMPLPVDVQTLPLYLAERWRGEPFDEVAGFSGLLPWARAGNLLFWWLLLFYAFRAGRDLGGPWAGRLAVALLACEPTLLAHAALATTDLAITACLLALVYHFRTAREATWPRRVGVPALWFAAAVLAKASGLVFGGICLVAVEVERRLALAREAGTTGWRNWLTAAWHNPPGTVPLFRDLRQIVGLGLVLTFLYCGSDWQPIDDLVAWAHSLPQNGVGQTAVAVAEGLRLFPNAGYALARQVSHNVRGHGVYLLGQTHQRALWYYFPVLLSIKLTVPLLLLPVLVALWRRRALLNWACVAAAALLGFSVACRVQIGVRFMLPLVALAVVGLSAAVAAAWREGNPVPRMVLALLLAVGLGWSATDCVWGWPHGLAYVNEAWGGMATGYRLVNDSNYDWGQGLKDLTRWQQAHPGELFVWYFGDDPSVTQLPLKPVHMHNHPASKSPWPHVTLAQLAGKRLAVSTTFLYFPPRNAQMQADQDFLRALPPIGQTTTFQIYDIPEGYETVLPPLVH
jgi:hypothetical protein